LRIARGQWAPGSSNFSRAARGKRAPGIVSNFSRAARGKQSLPWEVAAFFARAHGTPEESAVVLAGSSRKAAGSSLFRAQPEGSSGGK